MTKKKRSGSGRRQKRTLDEHLLAENHFSETVIESLPGLFFMFDRQYRYVRWNKNLEKLFGYTAEELPNVSALDTVAPEDRAAVEKEIQRGFKGGETAVEYNHIVRGNRRVPFYGTARTLTLGGKEYLVGLSVDISARKKAEDALQKAFREIAELREQLQSDYTYLREEIKSDHDFGQIIGQSDALRYVLFRVEQIAPTDTTVLILGETGTGKELVARAIHEASPRKDRPLVKVNCATLQPSLIENELFGHEKGAFTGAQHRQAGRFEVAHGTTILLDEVGELPLEVQGKLLRAVQDGEFERLGGSKTVRVDVRIIAATNRDLEGEVKKGLFREDLWYRLNVFPVTVPPLRERSEDIPLLVHAFVNRFAKKLGKRIDTVPQKAMKSLQEYSWPGNVRELENVIERAVVNTRGATLRLADELKKVQGRKQTKVPTKSLEEVEREYILQVLESTNWRVGGEKGAALILGLHVSTLRGRMRKLGIHPPWLK